MFLASGASPRGEGRSPDERKTLLFQFMALENIDQPKKPVKQIPLFPIPLNHIDNFPANLRCPVIPAHT